MPILHQFAPNVPLLAAPPPRLQLPAPRIAGLLADGKPKNAPQIIVDRLTPFARKYGPFMTIEEADAEIAAIMEEGLQKLRAEREARRKMREARHATLEGWWEIVQQEMADAQRERQHEHRHERQRSAQ